MTGVAVPRRHKLCIRNLSIPHLIIPGAEMEGTSPPLLPPPVRQERRLLVKQIRRQLRRAPRLSKPALIVVVFDESGSVTGGNDPVGLRHEIVLVVLEHLGAVRGPAAWCVCLLTFDGSSAIDLPLTHLDKKGIERVRGALLSASAGGSSVLGPSLRRAHDAIDAFPGPSLLVVLSDYELFDGNRSEVLTSMVNGPADEVVVVSLRNEVPAECSGARVRGVKVLPDDTPAGFANQIVNSACLVAETAPRSQT